MAMKSGADPYTLAAWSYLQLGEEHPYLNGIGRAQRIDVNYILEKMGCSPFDWSQFTQGGHLDVKGEVGQIMAAYNEKVFNDGIERHIRDGSKKTSDHMYDIAMEYHRQVREGTYPEAEMVRKLAGIFRAHPIRKPDIEPEESAGNASMEAQMLHPAEHILTGWFDAGKQRAGSGAATVGRAFQSARKSLEDFARRNFINHITGLKP